MAWFARFPNQPRLRLSGVLIRSYTESPTDQMMKSELRNSTKTLAVCAATTAVPVTTPIQAGLVDAPNSIMQLFSSYNILLFLLFSFVARSSPIPIVDAQNALEVSFCPLNLKKTSLNNPTLLVKPGKPNPEVTPLNDSKSKSWGNNITLDWTSPPPSSAQRSCKLSFPRQGSESWVRSYHLSMQKVASPMPQLHQMSTSL